LRKSELRRVGEWFLAVRAIASSWILKVGVMAVCRAVLSYILYWRVAFVQRSVACELRSAIA
jgi:hypothetical protein